MSELPIREPGAVVISVDDLRDLEAAREALADPRRVPHREVLAEYGVET